MHTKKRNGEIDFWKFVFSLVIVVFHTFHYKSIFGLQPFIGGSSSVEFFFIVSGFLMAQSASRIISGEFKIAEETRNFMLRKIKGLYPEFAIAWLFGFVVMHLGKESVSFGKVVKDLMTGSWELFLLRMSGLEGYRGNVVTWYISAMILIMLILYPLLLKYKDTFIYILAPCLSIFLGGYMFQTFGIMGGGTVWEGFYYRGMMRAVVDLSLGCIVWKICQRIKMYQYTKLARGLFSLVEIGGYGFCLFWMLGHKNSSMDFVLLMIFAFCVLITFSHVGLVADMFDNRLCYTLGRASFSVYIGHIYWIKTIDKFFPSYTFESQLLILIVLISITTVSIMFLSDIIRKIMPLFIQNLKKMLIIH